MNLNIHASYYRPNDVTKLDMSNLNMTSWFLRSEVSSKRSQLALLIREIAESQAEGKVLDFPELK